MCHTTLAGEATIVLDGPKIGNAALQSKISDRNMEKYKQTGSSHGRLRYSMIDCVLPKWDIGNIVQPQSNKAKQSATHVPVHEKEFYLITVQPWTSGQMRKIAGCAYAGNDGNVFLGTAVQRSRHASQHVRYARAVMHAGIAI